MKRGRGVRVLVIYALLEVKNGSKQRGEGSVHKSSVCGFIDDHLESGLEQFCHLKLALMTEIDKMTSSSQTGEELLLLWRELLQTDRNEQMLLTKLCWLDSNKTGWWLLDCRLNESGISLSCQDFTNCWLVVNISFNNVFPLYVVFIFQKCWNTPLK